MAMISLPASVATSNGAPLTSLDIVAALAPVTEVFGQLKIAYSIGGSVASSVHGRARATMDIDIVAALPPHCVNDLVDALCSDYYIDHNAILDAIERRALTEAGLVKE